MIKKIFSDKNGELRIVWSIVYGYVFLYAAVILAVAGLGSFVFPGESDFSIRMMQILMGVLGTPAFIFITNLYFKRLAVEKRRENFDFFHKSIIVKIVIGILLGVVYGLLNSVVLVIIGQADMAYVGALTAFQIFAGIMTFTGMATLEECLFRGVIQEAFQKYGMLIGIILSAIFFTLTHQDLWVEFHVLRVVELLAASVMFALATISTKSLSFATAMHMAMNVSSAILFGNGTENAVFVTTYRHGYNFLVGQETGGSLISIIIIVTFIIGFYLYGKKKGRI